MHASSSKGYSIVVQMAREPSEQETMRSVSYETFAKECNTHDYP